jgi:hypothetical protein
MGSISQSQDAATAVSLRIEAARDAADNELAAISAELRTKMAQALSGFISTVPSFRLISNGHAIECESIVADEVSEALNEMEPMHYLLMALKDSPCPLVSKLRVSIINHYSNSTAERVAEARDE